MVNTINREDDYLIRVRALPPCFVPIEDFAVLRYGRKSGANVDFVSRKFPEINDQYEVKRIFNSPLMSRNAVKDVIGKSRIVDVDILDKQSDEEFYLFMATPRLDPAILFSDGNHQKFMGKDKNSRRTL